MDRLPAVVTSVAGAVTYRCLTPVQYGCQTLLRMLRAARLPVLLVCGLPAVWGCAAEPAAMPGAGPKTGIASLSHTADSPAALAREVLGAFERRDAARLRALALSEREFRDQVWPGLPASRPGRNLPAEYVWRELRQKSEGSLARLLASLGGRRLELVDVSFEGPTTRHGAYSVRRGTVLTVRDESGETGTLRAFGSTIETGGRVKVFSFVVE